MVVENVREYLSALERELRFDPALARRLCAEVEDHLLESAETCGERAAVARFGTPEVVAAQAATVSFHRRTRAAAGSAVIVVLAMFFLMQSRLAWYGMLHWRVVPNPASVVDRYAFVLGALPPRWPHSHAGRRGRCSPGTTPSVVPGCRARISYR